MFLNLKFFDAVLNSYFRFGDLVLLSKTRERTLEYSLEFHSLCQEIEEIRSWMTTKIPHLNSEEFGSDLIGIHIFSTDFFVKKI